MTTIAISAGRSAKHEHNSWDFVTGTPLLTDYASFAVDSIEVQPDAAGNQNIAGATEIAMGLYYVDELATDLWASLDAALDSTTDPATVNCTVNPTCTITDRPSTTVTGSAP